MIDPRGLAETFLLAIALAGAALGPAWAAEDEETPPELLGRCSAEQVFAAPFDAWSRSGYDDYAPHNGTLAQLRALDLSEFELTVFFGSWCGDSRRELPRLLKLADAMEMDETQLVLVAVDRGGEMHKRSPQGQDAGLEIYRVPTVIVRRGGREVARIVEYPVRSLERDLLAIFTGRDYAPNYASYPHIRRWRDDGLLADPNVSAHGLAADLRHEIAGEGELAAAAQVLLARGETREAIKLFEVNCALHRESVAAWSRLAEAWLQADEPAAAREAVARALRLNTDPERVGPLLEMIDPLEP